MCQARTTSWADVLLSQVRYMKLVVSYLCFDLRFWRKSGFPGKWRELRLGVLPWRMRWLVRVLESG